MLTSFAFALLVGCALGYMAGLGVGGGSLLILYLTLFQEMTSDTARLINLMFFLTAAGSVCLLRLGGRVQKWRKILPAIIAGSIMAAIFSFVRSFVHQEILRKLFGVLLLFTGTRELLYRPRKAK